jgi:hypothetical protein
MNRVLLPSNITRRRRETCYFFKLRMSNKVESCKHERVSEQNEGLAIIETYDMMQFCSPLCCSWNPFTCMTIDS